MIRLGSPHRQPARPGDVVDALLDCHARIRDFVALALRLASASGLAAAEAQQAAGDVRRYFEVALPLHAADEEASILPRLRGLDPAVDAELDHMRREHAEHERAVGRLVAACRAIQERPDELGRAAPALAEAARELDGQFAAHLDREERVIFPAIRTRLDREAQEAIRAEMRARRA